MNWKKREILIAELGLKLLSRLKSLNKIIMIKMMMLMMMMKIIIIMRMIMMMNMTMMMKKMKTSRTKMKRNKRSQNQFTLKKLDLRVSFRYFDKSQLLWRLTRQMISSINLITKSKTWKRDRIKRRR